MIRLSFLFIFCLFVAATTAQGVSPTGKEDGTALYDAAETLEPGNYVFTSAVGKQSLTFISAGNLLVPKTSGQNAWTVKQHKNTKYFSAHGWNDANLEKCISTRWTIGDGDGGYPDAAVLWQCEVDTTDHTDLGGYAPIFPPKQLWLAVPDQKYDGYYKIVSASHLYDMVPRCIDTKPITGGTKLTTCKIDTESLSLLWKIQKQ